MNLAPVYRLALVMLALTFALACPGSSRAESAFRCKNLESDPALATIEGKHGFFFRILADLRMQHLMTVETVARIGELSEALKNNGTTLIYVPIPTKSQALPGMLPDEIRLYGFDPNIAQTEYSDQIKLLRQHGIVAVDLMTAMQSNDPVNAPFFKSDFHWTSHGADLAAEAIAKTIKAQASYEGLTLSQFETVDLGPATAFSSMRRVIQRHCMDNVPEARTNAFTTKQVSQEGAGVDIFGGDKSSAEIAIVGTSFSDAEFQNFGGFLSQHAGLGVSNQAVTGGNQFGAIISYLTSASFAENRPKFLVWENPIYNNLADFGSGVLSELITAARGNCAPIAANAITANGLSELHADLGTQSLQARDVIYVYAGDDGSRKAVLELHRRNGKVATESVERGARVQTSGRFFVSVEPMWSDDIASLVVKFDRIAPETARVGICATTGG